VGIKYVDKIKCMYLTSRNQNFVFRRETEHADVVEVEVRLEGSTRPVHEAKFTPVSAIYKKQVGEQKGCALSELW
jgi:hypothetical protein